MSGGHQRDAQGRCPACLDGELLRPTGDGRSDNSPWRERTCGLCGRRLKPAPREESECPTGE